MAIFDCESEIIFHFETTNFFLSTICIRNHYLFVLTLIVPKYSATLFMQGGGHIWPPPLSSVIAVIKGQTKKQMIKFCKKTNFEQFFNGYYRYLTVKPPKTVIHINASGRCIFYSINLKFYEKARFLICYNI